MTMFNIEKGRMVEVGDVVYFDGEFDSAQSNKYFKVDYTQTIIRDVILSNANFSPDETKEDILVNGDQLSEVFEPTDYSTIYQVRMGLHETDVVLYTKYPYSRVIGRLQAGNQNPTPGDDVLGYQAILDYTMIPVEKLPEGFEFWFVKNHSPSFKAWNTNQEEYDKLVPKFHMKVCKITQISKEEADRILVQNKEAKLWTIVGDDKILF